MEPSAVVGLAADIARRVVPEIAAPALLSLQSIPVSAEVWEGEHHIRLVGEAIYAVHRGDRAQWAVVVRESSQLSAGSIHLVDLDEICVISRSGRHGG